MLYRYFLKLKTTTESIVGEAGISNVLAILERMTALRQQPQFWLQGLEIISAPIGENHENVNNDDMDDDWRTFFDDQPAAAIVPSLRSKSRKVRAHTAFGSHFSHQTRISACWTSLMPFLTSSAEFSARALTILHVVTPEFRQPFMLMDWISGCVDYGPKTWNDS
jgi:hypothetical protein